MWSKPPNSAISAFERPLAGMAEGRMAEVVGERQRLGEVLVQPQRARDRPGDLRHLQRVGEARAVVVAFVHKKDLGLLLQPPEGGGMKNAVAVALEFGPRRAWRLIVRAGRGFVADSRHKARVVRRRSRCFRSPLAKRKVPQELTSTPPLHNYRTVGKDKR